MIRYFLFLIGTFFAFPVLAQPWIEQVTDRDTIFWKTLFLDASYYDDASVVRFVWKENPLNDREYIPTWLGYIAWEFIDERGRRSMLRFDANEALQLLATEFYATFQTKLVVVSAYRSSSYQQRLWDLGRCSVSLCALPWRSEHQLWLAIDIFEASTVDDFFRNPQYTQYYSWLSQNAHRYGWIQSYKNGEAIDGYEVEPWHWRYVGVDFATRLFVLEWSFTQYIYMMKTLSYFQTGLLHSVF